MAPAPAKEHHECGKRLPADEQSRLGLDPVPTHHAGSPIGAAAGAYPRGEGKISPYPEVPLVPSYCPRLFRHFEQELSQSPRARERC